MRSAIVETWSDGDTGHGWDGYVVRYELARPVAESDRAAAQAFVDDALAPASDDFVLAELARLRALTVSRDVGQDLALVFSAYADELARYPADVVREVLRGWRGKFWPAWSELAERLDRLVKPREALRDAIRRGYHATEQAPDRVAPSDEDRRHVAELLARHGVKLDDRGRAKRLERDPMTTADRARMAAELAEFRARWQASTMAEAAE